MPRQSSQRLQRLEFHGNMAVDFDTIGFLVLAALLAVVALIVNSVPLLVGAMILTPLFDHILAVPFGLANRDWQLAWQGAWRSLVLWVIAFGACLLAAWVFLDTPLAPHRLTEPDNPLLAERLQVDWSSVVVGLVAGAGGALASASNRQMNLLGVVVALALVPALAAGAIAFISGRWNGWAGLGLFGVNVLGIVVAGLLVLLFRRAAGRAEDGLERQVQRAGPPPKRKKRGK